MTTYAERVRPVTLPRIPLEGSLDLTYRCNNDCRHCWLRIPPGDKANQDELSFDEIRDIVDQARALGTRRWSLSGGEPMLRPDFPEIFDYITSRSVGYSLNTNGMLITPEIAQLMRRPGNKMVAVYGATAEVHDHITRHPGAFEATMRGFAYLREAGVNFTVQLIPMRDNFHQWEQMQALAASLSPRWRCGAAWLYLSASGDPARNAEIARQRLSPEEVIVLDPPAMTDRAPGDHAGAAHAGAAKREPYGDRLFAACIAGRRDFHIDPYGGMTFCGFIKDPELIYDLRAGTVREAWEVFIPSLSNSVRGGAEYREACGACDKRDSCRWCPVYGYLEHRRFSAPVDYLCQVAEAAERYKATWLQDHRRYYRIAGITLQVDADLPITESTFAEKFELFRAAGPGADTVTISHHFSLPDIDDRDLGEEVYRRPPWAVYRKGNAWIYLGISTDGSQTRPHRVATFSADYAHARIHHPDASTWERDGHGALTLFSSDQILISQLLAHRNGAYLHSSGVVLNGQSLLFVGHSGAGKSTISRMLEPHGQVLCDDRNIVRRWPPAGDNGQPTGFHVYGTWSHGEWPVVSSASGPLRAVMFLEQAPENNLTPIDDRTEILRRLLACLIKPHVTAAWWERTFDLMEALISEVPAYRLQFDRSGAIVPVLDAFSRS